MLSVSSAEFLREEAAHLSNVYQQAYSEVQQELSKPNVLVTGITGSGKSSFVNAVFGESLARTGCGQPITQHFDRFSPGHTPIVLYDSKGLEYGQSEEFIRVTREFLKSQHSEGGAQSIHVVWYIINSASARFQDFERVICEELFNQLPIMFILNKADISTEEQRSQLRDVIASMKLHNMVGVYETVASDTGALGDEVSHCRRCNSEDVAVFRKRNLVQCESCGYKYQIKKRKGLAAVIRATVDVLPRLARDSFIASQRAVFSIKEARIKRIILQFRDDLMGHAKKPAAVMRDTAKVLTRLSIMWDVREHGNMYGVDMAEHGVQGLSFRDGVVTDIGKNDGIVCMACAITTLWNRCLRALSLALSNMTADGDVAGANFANAYSTAFDSLNRAQLNNVERAITESGLEAVLEREMPPVAVDDGLIPLRRSTSIPLELDEAGNQPYKISRKPHGHRKAESSSSMPKEVGRTEKRGSNNKKHEHHRGSHHQHHASREDMHAHRTEKHGESGMRRSTSHHEHLSRESDSGRHPRNANSSSEDDDRSARGHRKPERNASLPAAPKHDHHHKKHEHHKHPEKPHEHKKEHPKHDHEHHKKEHKHKAKKDGVGGDAAIPSSKINKRDGRISPDDDRQRLRSSSHSQK